MHMKLGLQLERIGPIQPESNLIFEWVWTNIFIIQVEFELSFIRIWIWIRLELRFEKLEPNPSSI